MKQEAKKENTAGGNLLLPVVPQPDIPKPYTCFIVQYSPGGLRDKWNEQPNYHTEKSGAEYEAKLNYGGRYYAIKKVLMCYKPDHRAKWHIKAIFQTWYYYPGETEQLKIT